MLVDMERGAFETLDDASLIWACIEPTIRQIRGKSLAIKKDVGESLSDAQQALLMFQVLLGHTRNGSGEFYAGQSYMLSEKGVWGQFRKSAQFFGDEALLLILTKMEADYTLRYAGTSPAEAEKMNGETPRNNGIDAELSAVLPASVREVASYIRSNPGLFVQFKE